LSALVRQFDRMRRELYVDCNAELTTVSEGKRQRCMRQETDRKDSDRFHDAKEKEGGGIITSRIPRITNVPIPRDLRIDRYRIEALESQSIPLFAGCPDWVKPMLYYEYQERSPCCFLSRNCRFTILFCRRGIPKSGCARFLPA
jgi:hypothetical protein